MSLQEINAVEWRREKSFEDFVRVNGDRMKEHYEDDSGWVEDTEAKLRYVQKQFDEGCSYIFDRVSAEGCAHCEDCDYNEGTPDAFGTGDSPTMYECTNTEATECPQVIDSINSWFD